MVVGGGSGWCNRWYPHARRAPGVLSSRIVPGLSRGCPGVCCPTNWTTRPLRSHTMRTESARAFWAGWSLVYFYVELPWRWMVSRGAAAASDGSGGAGAPLALRLMPTLRLEQTPAFLAAMAPTKGHPDCATHCSSQGERQARTSFKPGVNATCDRCVCAKVRHHKFGQYVEVWSFCCVLLRFAGCCAQPADLRATPTMLSRIRQRPLSSSA